MRSAAILIAAALAIPAPAGDLGSDLENLVAAERGFAALSEKSGMKTAFLANLAEDSVVFDDGPTSGRKTWEASPEVAGTLRWTPSYAEIAASGDLGVSTGPWEFVPAAEGKPSRHGHFFSIWRRDAKGIFRVVLDGGIHHEPGTPFPSEPRRRAPSGRGKPHGHPRESLLDAERALSEDAGSLGFAAALAERAAPDAGIYRDGAPPAEGRAAAAASADRKGAVVGSGVSAAGDLGYAYGTGTSAGKKVSWIRVWRREGRGRWRVGFDVEIPIRP